MAMASPIWRSQMVVGVSRLMALALAVAWQYCWATAMAHFARFLRDWRLFFF